MEALLEFSELQPSTQPLPPMPAVQFAVEPVGIVRFATILLAPPIPVLVVSSTTAVEVSVAVRVAKT